MNVLNYNVENTFYMLGRRGGVGVGVGLGWLHVNYCGNKQVLELSAVKIE